MKKLISIGLLSLLLLSGVALANQSSEQEKNSSSMQNNMGEMMKGDKGDKGMEGMGGMMRMMKMMNHCSSMMDSTHANDEKTEQGQQK